ncbi:nuclear transport factor 2 family protein [Dyella mobilis]|uniref:DUF4440 domain-containing protein n=1 Tax=Dyella mobilis TaxID=1849582 RepID=A0ABS2KEG7_9GAMM|nr:DUF4440 domain-containing protein [Dyella mobilis]MBM7129564.1 DUF4440 domain-containing protein [Dyella mobilis]GLQ98171.1 hypothetical protein GCM10007863_25910 [Dyella mobilis]
MLLETLRVLEISLHDPHVRSNQARLEALLHPAFRELGRSGMQYSLEDIVAHVVNEGVQPVIWSQDFELEQLAPDVALLIYRSAHVAALDQLECYTNRASLWQHTEDGWKMRFHQGTPTSAFDKRDT